MSFVSDVNLEQQNLTFKQCLFPVINGYFPLTTIYDKEIRACHTFSLQSM